MKKVLTATLLLVLGVGVGGAAAYGARQMLGSASAPAAAPPTSFVPTGPILAPLVFPDGRLSGYVTFEAQLEVADTEREAVMQRLPVLIHAVNMRTYRTPMASGADGLIPGLEAFRRVVNEAATETYGPGVVRRTAVTKAAPA